MSRAYKFRNPDGCYFVSFAIVKWLPILESDDYKGSIVDSLKYCQQYKNMEIIAWCIMPSHVHLVYRTIGERPEQVLGSLKRYTSATIRKKLESEVNHRTRAYLEVFQKAGNYTSNTASFQFWQHDNMPIELWSNQFISQKVRYTHQNPVEAGLVGRAADYIFSSARDYEGKPGLIDNIVLANI